MIYRLSLYLFVSFSALILCTARPTTGGSQESVQGSGEDGTGSNPQNEITTLADCFRFEITNCFFRGPNDRYIVCDELTPHLQGGCTQNVTLEYNIANALGAESMVATGGNETFGIPNIVFETSIARNSTPILMDLCATTGHDVTIGGAAQVGGTYFGCETARAAFSINLISSAPSMNPTISMAPSPVEGISAAPSIITPSPSISAAPSITGKKGGKKGGKYYKYSCGNSSTKAPKGAKKSKNNSSTGVPTSPPTHGPSARLATKSPKSGKKGSKSRTCDQCIEIMQNDIEIPSDTQNIDIYYSVEIFIKDEHNNMTKAEIEEAVLEVLNGIFKATISGCSDIQANRRLTSTETAILSSANFTDLKVDDQIGKLGLCKSVIDEDSSATVCRGGEGKAVIRYSEGDSKDVTGIFTDLLNQKAKDISGFVFQVENLIFKKIVTKQRALVDRSKFYMGLKWIIPTLVAGTLIIIYGAFVVVRHGRALSDDRRDKVPLFQPHHIRSDDIKFPMTTSKSKWASVLDAEEITDDSLNVPVKSGLDREYEIPKANHDIVGGYTDTVTNREAELTNEAIELSYYER